MKQIQQAALMASASFLAWTPAALAQTETPEPAQQTPADDSGDAQSASDNEAIVVTGSLIARDGYDAPTPVAVLPASELRNSKPSTIVEALRATLPSLASSASPNNGTNHTLQDPSHGNLLDLRALGPQRTLILLDGVRVPATTYTGLVDTNVLPDLLVERVDVVTGGASAAYGSDAVSGVVNFILDTDYTGIKGVINGGISSRGDNESYKFGIAGALTWASAAIFWCRSMPITTNRSRFRRGSISTIIPRFSVPPPMRGHRAP